MTREQFKIIIVALTSNYRTFAITEKVQFDYWYSMLQDIPYKQIQLTVNKYIAEEKWPPTIACLRKSFIESTEVQALDSNSAWGEVQDAIRYHGSYGEKKAFESMSPVTAEVIKNMGYKDLCMSQNQMADRAHFMKMYDSYSERKQKTAQLPPTIQKQLSETIGAKALGLEMPKYK